MTDNRNTIEDLNKGLLETATKIIEKLKSENTNSIIQEWLGYTNAILPLVDLGNSEIFRNFTMLFNLHVDTATNGGHS